MNAPPKAFETPGPKPGLRADAIDWKARAETAEGLLTNTNKILQEAFGDHSLSAKILEVTKRAEKAERELAEAIEALKPFASEHELWHDDGYQLPADTAIEIAQAGYSTMQCRFNLGDLRRAAAIIAKATK